MFQTKLAPRSGLAELKRSTEIGTVKSVSPKLVGLVAGSLLLLVLVVFSKKDRRMKGGPSSDAVGRHHKDGSSVEHSGVDRKPTKTKTNLVRSQSEVEKYEVAYRTPEGYEGLLSRAVYTEFSSSDPFVWNPDEGTDGLMGPGRPTENLKRFGLKLSDGSSFRHIPPTSTLVVKTDAKGHEQIVSLHVRIGIPIKKVEQDAAPQIRPRW